MQRGYGGDIEQPKEPPEDPPPSLAEMAENLQAIDLEVTPDDDDDVEEISSP